MAFVVFQGERKLADVVTRAFGDLKVADRKRAEAALVRANPHLAEIKDVAKGSLIVVPPVPGLDPAGAQTDLAAPAADAVGAVADALEALQRRLRESAKAEGDRIAALQALVKSKNVRVLIDKAPQAGPYVERVAKAAETRAAELDRRQLAIKQLDQARPELAELADRLR